MDASLPEIGPKQRSNYAEGYPLLQADLQTDFRPLLTDIGCEFSSLLEGSRNNSVLAINAKITEKVLEPSCPQRLRPMSPHYLQNAFAPIMENTDIFNVSPRSRQSFSFDRGTKIVAEDVAPYVRIIVSHDMFLEQQRLALNRLLLHGSKRARTTRASRAAMEGGNKANIRNERWFTPKLVPSVILSTGSKEWQELLTHQESEGLSGALEHEESRSSDGNES